MSRKELYAQGYSTKRLNKNGKPWVICASCDSLVHIGDAYRCYYCKNYFCDYHANEHFKTKGVTNGGEESSG